MFWGLGICKENVMRKMLWERRCEKDVRKTLDGFLLMFLIDFLWFFSVFNCCWSSGGLNQLHWSTCFCCIFWMGGGAKADQPAPKEYHGSSLYRCPGVVLDLLSYTMYALYVYGWPFLTLLKMWLGNIRYVHLFISLSSPGILMTFEHQTAYIEWKKQFICYLWKRVLFVG